MGLPSIAAALVLSVSSQIFFPATGVTVEKEAVLLAVDDVSLPLKENVCYYISKPEVRKEPVLAPNRDHPNSPDEVAPSSF